MRRTGRMGGAIEDDATTIREVIERMHDAIWAKDIEAFAQTQVDADYTRRWAFWLPGTVVIKEGWTDIRERIAQVMADPREGGLLEHRSTECVRPATGRSLPSTRPSLRTSAWVLSVGRQCRAEEG